MTRTLLFGAFAVSLLACDDVKNPEETNENEVITTVELTFSPQDGGDDIVATWADAELDGMADIDDITLADGTTYDLSITFLNELEDPAEDITEEIDAEADEHQIFFTGTAAQSAATGDNTDAIVDITYNDVDSSDWPVGLSTVVVAGPTGTGELTITLRHLPEEGDAILKTGDLAAIVAADGITALPGSTDVSVTFDLTVE